MGFELGYQFNTNFAIEFNYLSYESHKYASSSTVTGDLDFYSLGLLGKGLYPVNDQFDVFGKLGIVRTEAEFTNSSATRSKDKKWTGAFGIGAAYHVNENVTVNLQDIYTMGTEFLPPFNALLIGAGYQFSV